MIHQHTELNLLSSNILHVILRNPDNKESYLCVISTYERSILFTKYTTLYHERAWKLVALATFPAYLLPEIKYYGVQYHNVHAKCSDKMVQILKHKHTHTHTQKCNSKSLFFYREGKAAGMKTAWKIKQN
jgi:hypothetical protein